MHLRQKHGPAVCKKQAAEPIFCITTEKPSISAVLQEMTPRPILQNTAK
jgi:hypothetical protein